MCESLSKAELVSLLYEQFIAPQAMVVGYDYTGDRLTVNDLRVDFLCELDGCFR